jgi:hypothetical protein
VNGADKASRTFPGETARRFSLAGPTVFMENRPESIFNSLAKENTDGVLTKAG